MADWQAISEEIRRGSRPVTAPNGDFDTVRKAKLRALEAVTGRPVVLYATDFTNQLKANVAPQFGASVSIDL